MKIDSRASYFGQNVVSFFFMDGLDFGYLFYSLLERAKRRHIPHRHEINGFGEGKKILNSIALNKEDQKKR